MHEGALTLEECMLSLMDLYALGFLCIPIGSAVPRVEAPFDHCSSSLHSLAPVEH